MWLIEENAPLQSKAAEVCKRDREERGIKNVDWPASSPDLHPIEEAWFYTDEMLEPQWCDMRGAGKEAQLTDVWGSDNIQKDAQGICNR